MIQKIKKLLQKYAKSKFVSNTIKLVSGTAFAQMISILTAPILYRIYQKDDYGTLGLYMAIVGSIGSFSTMQYSQALILEKDDDDAIQVLWLIRLINLGLAVLILFFILVSNKWIAVYLNNPDISLWLNILPISIFFSGQNEVFRIWANRKKEYGIMTWNAILTSVLVPVVSISVGLLYKNPLGLFLGLLTSQIVPAIYLWWELKKKQSFSFRTMDFSKVKVLARKHIAFPLYSLPADFINRFSNQLPVFMLSAFAGSSSVGVYNLSVRMLGLPSQLIAGAVGEVFRQRATEDYHREGDCHRIFLKTLKTLVVMAVLPLLVILLFGPDLFAFVFGEKWREAGVFSRILSGLFFLRFFASPLSYLFIIAGKQKQDFYWHIVMAFFSFTSFYVGFKWFNSDKVALFLFAFGYSLIYLIYLLYSYKYSKGNKPSKTKVEN